MSAASSESTIARARTLTSKPHFSQNLRPSSFATCTCRYTLDTLGLGGSFSSAFSSFFSASFFPFACGGGGAAFLPFAADGAGALGFEGIAAEEVEGRGWERDSAAVVRTWWMSFEPRP